MLMRGRRHVRRADLEGDDEIAEGRKRQRNDAQKHHDRSVHRAERVIQRSRSPRRFGAMSDPNRFFEQRCNYRDGLGRVGDGPAHRHHQAETEKQEQPMRVTAMLDADDLVVGGKNVFPQEAQLLVVMIFICAPACGTAQEGWLPAYLKSQWWSASRQLLIVLTMPNLFRSKLILLGSLCQRRIDEIRSFNLIKNHYS